jgi:hypothetical protein
MVNKQGIRKQLLNVWIICNLFFILLLSVSCKINSKSENVHPLDKTLEEIFWANENEFNQLILMSKVDSKVIRITKDFTWLENNYQVPRPESELGFSVEHWDEYKNLFVKLKLNGGLLQYPDQGIIYLIASNKGLVTGGSNKGYAFSTKELPSTFGSLDEIQYKSKKGATIYKNIKGSWYLYYRND